MRKNPVYRVTIHTKDEDVIITLPLTCNMSIRRSILASDISASVQIYNLNKTTRNKIYQPPFQQFNERKFITIEAGYGDLNNAYLIFKGVIMQAFSSKGGASVDIVTEIQANSFTTFSDTSLQVESGTPVRDVFKTISNDLPNCTIGNIGAIGGEIQTTTTFDGNTLEQMQKITGGNTFVDNGTINCILQNECIDVPVPLITSHNALLETPRRSAANLTVKTLFEPSVIVGQLVEIDSQIEDDFDGQYKCIGITHDLMFSETQSGTRTTTLELLLLPSMTASPIAITGGKSETTAQKVKQEELEPLQPTPQKEKWIMPCKGVITSNFGKRKAPVPNASTFHNGIDIGVPTGTPIKAIADGVIVAAGKAKGYGNWVAINHGNVNGKQVTSEYGHISSWLVRVGQKVTQGQIIAKAGNAGLSSGSHCHLTIREGSFQGKGVNPFKYISA